MKKIINFLKLTWEWLLASFSFLKGVFMMFMVICIVVGVLLFTLACLFELIYHVTNTTNPNVLIIFHKPIWDVIVVIIGGLTMWTGLSKVFDFADHSTDPIKSGSKVKHL